jgi:hypothetical protein
VKEVTLARGSDRYSYAGIRCGPAQMTSNKDKPRVNGPDFATDQEIVTFRYRGPDRRGAVSIDIKEFMKGEKVGEVTFDAKGNPIWQLKVDIPRRREDDDTIDLLKCLDVDSLSLEDDSEPEDVPGYNPYGDRARSK